MRTLIIILVLDLWINNVYAQNGYNYHIDLFTNSGLCKIRSELEIDLSRFHDKMIISYSVLDSIQTIKLRNDPEKSRIVEAERKLITHYSSDSDKILGQEFHNLMLKYSIFFKDTLVLNRDENKKLFDYVDLFGMKDHKFVDEMKPRTDYMLDGNYFDITITDSSKLTTKFYIHELDEKCYPISYKLVTSLLDIYRIKHPNSLFKKSHKTLYY